MNRNDGTAVNQLGNIIIKVKPCGGIAVITVIVYK